MVVAYGHGRGAGLPDFAEHEEALDRLRILNADGHMHYIATVDIPTGTTPPQDRLMRLVRDVRYRQRQFDTAVSAHRRKALSLRLRPLRRSLQDHIDAIGERLDGKAEGWIPDNAEWYGFYCTVRVWMLRLYTMERASALMRKGADRLIPPGTLPVTPDIVAQLESDQQADTQRIDSFIRAYDTMDVKNDAGSEPAP